MITHHRLNTCIVVMVVIFSSIDAAAEQYFDIYGGSLFSSSSTQKYSGDFSSTPFPSIFSPNARVTFSAKSSDVKTDSSFTGGFRYGSWDENLGLGVDVMYFQIKSGEQLVRSNSRATGPGGSITLDQDTWPKTLIHVIGVTFDIRGRLQLLKDETYTHGRLQPYIGIAPGIFFGIVSDPDYSEISNSASAAGLRPTNQYSPSTPIFNYTWPGAKANVGVSFNITPSIAPFVEYRFVYLHAERENDGVTFKGDFLTHHFVGGLSFRF